MTRKIPLTRGKFARVSTVDYDYLNQWKWQCSAKGYAVRSEYDPETRQSRTTFMHKIVMDAPPGQQVDHINGDKLDNRRCNLRFVTPAQNARNRAGLRDGYKGVSPRENGNFTAYIAVDGKQLNLGTYPDEETAARVYDAASERFHGEYGWRNFPDEELTDVIREMMSTGLNRHTPGIDPLPRPVPVKRASDYIGVKWENGRWAAYIVVGQKHLYLGQFDNEKAAARAFDRAVMLYRPYSGRLNFQEEWEYHRQIILLKHGEFPAREFYRPPAAS